MKKLLLIFALLPAFCIAQQKDCEYTYTQSNDGVQLRWTKDYLMYEKVFGGNSQYVFFSLTSSDGIPVLNFQLLSKSPEFPKVQCTDATSKLYIQLINGRIITLIPASQDSCANLIYDKENKLNIRVLSTPFLFTKGSMEDLEVSPISFIRVKYATETIDYSVKKELKSETLGGTYSPEQFFISQLKCLKAEK